jgi:hypothetical protein
MSLNAIREIASTHWVWTLILGLLMTFIWYYFLIVGMAAVCKVRGYSTFPRRILCIMGWIFTMVGTIVIWSLIAYFIYLPLKPEI